MYHYFLFKHFVFVMPSIGNNNNQTKQGMLQNKHGHMINHYSPHTVILPYVYCIGNINLKVLYYWKLLKGMDYYIV